MARTLGAPLTVPAGNEARTRSKARQPGAQLAFHMRHDVHHMRVALDGEELGHAHRAVLAHAAQVVAAQVHQHHVLGALLGVGQQLALQAAHPRPALVPRGRVPAIGRSVARRPSSRTNISGEAPTRQNGSPSTSPKSKKNI